MQAWFAERSSKVTPSFALGASLSEEVAACLLGGHGIPAEAGLAAFARLRESGLLQRQSLAAEIENALALPLKVGGRAVQYRFARQRSKYLSLCLRRIAVESPPAGDRAFRDWLRGFPGLGPKTASWITRN
jgi:N-glycosylase/DNA lyase